MSDYVCIYRGNEPVEIEFIKSKLEDSGIPYMIRTNDASGTMPHLNLERGIEILVHKENEPEAKSTI
ncbi:MAG: DUF2007 domain-containing protein [Simkaniaceae bacterium]|jgi:hypothetical protein|nr:MAG: DUF2007 domain-containing protein [Simkaniaceae bacterium]